MHERFEARRGWVTVTARSGAPPERVWALLGDPARWPDWAPHLRGAEGLLEEGARIVVHGPAGVRLPTTITRVDVPWRWDFRAEPPGPLSLDSVHLLRPVGRGTAVAVHLRVARLGVVGLGPLAAYLPLARLAVGRLARLAEAEPAP